MSRRHRRFVSWLGIAAIAFAQFATAHAWLHPVHADLPASASALPHSGNCGGGEGGAVPQAPERNACKLQCSEAAPNAAAPDLPPVDIASAPVIVAPAVLATVGRALGRTFLAADIAAPPLLLRFCRLLN
jgi:hypothetical protein